MPSCPDCARDVAEGFPFCPHCGAAMEAPGGTREVRTFVSVLFTDVIGSTALGERLDPESIRRDATA